MKNFFNNYQDVIACFITILYLSSNILSYIIGGDQMLMVSNVFWLTFILSFHLMVYFSPKIKQWLEKKL
jgi:hypothetical protein